MKVVLVGEFSPPFDALTLYNLTLAEKHQAADDQTEIVDMMVLNEAGGSHFMAFLRQLFVAARGAERIHYLTHGYDRTSIFYLFFALLLGWLRGSAVDVTIHPELFAFFGPLRSHHVGKPLLRLCFRWASIIYCGNETVAETVVLLGGAEEKCVVQRPYLPWPETPLQQPELAAFVESNPSLVLLFVSEESRFLRSEAVALVRRWYGLQSPSFVIIPEAGVNVHEIAGLQEEQYFVWQECCRAEITYLLSRASLVIRPLQCMGQSFVPDYAFMLERPRRVGDYFDTGLGLTIIRKGKGLSGQFVSQPLSSQPAPLNQRILDVLPQVGRALFLGVFSPTADEETMINQAFCLEMERAGLTVASIKMPEDNFDSQQSGSFITFLGKISRLLKQNDLLLYSTQGFTRPSLLLLLGSTVLGWLRGKKVYVLFQRDAFSFFTQLRSRNAGLPLLFTAFTLAEGILTMDEDSYRAALQYKNAPEKFHIIQPDWSQLCPKTKPTLAPTTAVLPQNDSAFSTQLASGLAQKAVWQTSDQLRSFRVRPLQCNGELVAHEQAALIEPSAAENDEMDSAGVIVIPKANPQSLDSLLGGTN
ncbi:hypothetical protein [Candidatus Leptofilum sp.]|uniref:hypothetical protein n=1 Tax=Candidatus Leptofilum sp. TaxID=3241576 RepID=UPI003B590AA2